ncbi:MAG: response regulator transcription factor [Candidatus Carbobacillus altaicus]|nr:response regulator transcription factor [Candidatus Carbobacillus altaicus]
MKALIIDDHAIVRDGLEQLLTDAFLLDEVVFAADGAEALRLAFQIEPELVLLDLSLPGGVNGLSVLQELRKVLPKGKIVVFSMYDEIEYVRRAYSLGADGYIDKGQKAESIIEHLKLILQGQKSFIVPLDVLQETAEGEEGHAGLPLTTREKDIFVLTVLGHSQKEIAEKLSISPKTVENHRSNISKKLGTHKKSDWLMLAKRYQLLDLYK